MSIKCTGEGSGKKAIRAISSSIVGVPYIELQEKIKINMQEWPDTMDRYDDPEIEDMEEVWGL